jgi:hypothetical protein
VDLTGSLFLSNGTISAAALGVPASEKYEAYHDQENKETSTCQVLDRIPREIRAEGPAWTNSTQILVWYMWVGIGGG